MEEVVVEKKEEGGCASPPLGIDSGVVEGVEVHQWPYGNGGRSMSGSRK